MNIDITYSKASLKFMRKNPQAGTLQDIQSILITSLKKIFHQEDVTVDVKQLRGNWQGYYRIRKGKIRIIFSIREEKTVAVFVHTIDFRGNVY